MAAGALSIWWETVSQAAIRCGSDCQSVEIQLSHAFNFIKSLAQLGERIYYESRPLRGHEGA